MARKDLERIKEDLTEAEKHLKRAGNRADSVGDKSGSKKIQEGIEVVEKIRKNFDKSL